MLRLLIRELIDSVNEPSEMFRTLRDIVPVRDLYGEPEFVAGVGSVVFKVGIGGETYALKCYTQPREGLAEVYGYVGSLDSPIVYPVRFLPDELCVCSRTEVLYADVILMPWCGNHTLDFAIRRAAHLLDGECFRRLAEGFDRLAASLLECEWAHGDLKPDNIVISEQGAMSLVDFDSIYAPALPSRRAVGTLGYTHPSRNADDYSKAVDDYTIALLSVALHALAQRPELYAAYPSDGLLFSPEKIAADTDECFRTVTEMFQSDNRLSALCDILASKKPTYNLIQIFKPFTPCIPHQLPDAEKHSSF